MVHKFAFGVLGLTPFEYYTMSPYEFFCTCEGFFDKMDMKASQLRMVGYRLHQSLVSNPLKIEEFWPLFTDGKKEDDKIVMTREMREQIKKAYNLK